MEPDPPAGDPYNLERFVTAQAPVYEMVMSELRTGRKRTHWMWFIFPQMRGLGRSVTAEFFAITSLAEAHAYLHHPKLGSRLVACVQILLELRERSLDVIFGRPDDMKFQSSMTLFDTASGMPENVFGEALRRYCSGSADDQTLALLDATKR